MKLAAKGPSKHLFPVRVKSNDSMSSQNSFDLSLSVQQPAIVYSGDCVSILATLKSEQLVNFEMHLPLQAAYEVIACERSPLSLQGSNYHQSIEWTLQIKAPGSIRLPPLQAELTGLNSQRILNTQALSIEVQTYPRTTYDSKALKLPSIESDVSEQSPAWLLIPLLLIGLAVFFLRFRKPVKVQSKSTRDMDTRAQTAQGQPLLTPEIAAEILSRIPPNSPNSLRFNLEALAYKNMSPTERVTLTQTTKAYLEK